MKPSSIHLPLFFMTTFAMISSCSSPMHSGAVRIPAGSPSSPFIPGSENVPPPSSNRKGHEDSPRAKPQNRPAKREPRNRQNPEQPGPEDMVICEPPIQERSFAYMESTQAYRPERREFSALDAILQGAGKGTLTGFLEHDKNILSEWFGAGFSQDSEIFKVAQYSPLYKLIFDYAASDESQTQNPSIRVGGRLGFYLATLMSVSDNTECMRAVLGLGENLFADLKTLKGGNAYVAAFKDLMQSINTFVVHSQLGKAEDKFNELSTNKENAASNFYRGSDKVEVQKAKVESLQRTFLGNLQKDATRVAKMISDNRDCSQLRPVLTVENFNKEIDNLVGVAADCARTVTAKRDELKDRLAKLQSQGRQSTSIYSDTKKAMEAQEARLRRLNSEGPGTAVTILKDMKKSAEGYGEIAKQIELTNILNEELKEQERNLSLLATPYLTQGYLGGFLR